MCLLAVVLFLGVGLFWYGFKYRPYKKSVEKMSLDNDSETPRYTAVKGNYLYRVKMPQFLSFEPGFLYVGLAEEMAFRVLSHSISQFKCGIKITEIHPDDMSIFYFY